MTKERKEEIFYLAMCNFLGLGQEELYGLQVEYNPNVYLKVAGTLNDPAWEDVLMEMVKRGYTLSLKDIEGDMDSTINLQDIYDRMNLVPTEVIENFENDNDDIVDADIVIQTIFYKEVIFS